MDGRLSSLVIVVAVVVLVAVVLHTTSVQTKTLFIYTSSTITFVVGCFFDFCLLALSHSVRYVYICVCVYDRWAGGDKKVSASRLAKKSATFEWERLFVLARCWRYKTYITSNLAAFGVDATTTHRRIPT